MPKRNPSRAQTNMLRRSSSTKNNKPRTEELRGDAQVYSYITKRPSIPRHLKTEQVFSTIQTVVTTGFAVTSSSNPTFFSIQFSCADLDQASAFAAVFDQYKLNGIEVWIEPQAPNSNTSNVGRYVSVIDYDDVTNLTTVAQANDYSNALVSSGQSCQYRHFVPHQALAAYTGTFTGFTNTPAMWNDAASLSIKHYGVKTAFEPTASAYVYDISVRYHVLWKSVR